MTTKAPAILDTHNHHLKVARCGNGEAVLFNAITKADLGTFASVADAQAAAKRITSTKTKDGVTITRRKLEG